MPKSPVPKSPVPKSPVPSLWSPDDLKRRRQPSAPSLAGDAVPGDAAVIEGADAGGVAVRAQAAETALSSANVSDDGIAPETHGRSELSQEELELMDQAKNYVCKSCSTPVPLGHKFCGRCGAAIP
ncbi:MAG TPA: zinc ribbon domain-containing protein, partial [Candidatus Tumulicola sp.]|nr:zinc ribbon domain-containing protein [Candidatus Tumulicola sp.]